MYLPSVCNDLSFKQVFKMPPTAASPAAVRLCTARVACYSWFKVNQLDLRRAVRRRANLSIKKHA